MLARAPYNGLRSRPFLETLNRLPRGFTNFASSSGTLLWQAGLKE